uniref:Bee-milk protein n=1 Tax=Heliothis virescens TaxID=7102 RepID=A0A2A4K4U3_HELVI
MVNMICLSLILILFYLYQAATLLPPRFQWKTMDYAWEGAERESAITDGSYIAVNNMPTGIARWKDKLFITIPRWKKGIPSTLNYVFLNDTQSAPLHPYPNWEEGCLSPRGTVVSNRTVVSTFRVNVDKCDRLWVVDNGVCDMSMDVKQVSEPAILVFDLNSDELMQKHVFSDEVLRDTSVLTSVVSIDDYFSI